MSPPLKHPDQWIPETILTLIATILCYIILFDECRQRKNQSVKFTTPQLKVWSIICLISSFTLPLSILLSSINIMCTFAGLFIWLSVNTMALSMGFYQLSRLHYCFANSQVHSDKGYPKWLFILMYTIGILISINHIASIEFVKDSYIFLSKCGINNKFQFYSHGLDLVNTNVPSLYTVGVGLCFFGWDLFTLYLYILKIRTFRVYKDDAPNVYKRIKSILQKIFILTVLYQLSGVIFVGLIGLYFFVIDTDIIRIQLMPMLSSSCMSLIFSVSMYLMMDHNVKHYVRFLKIVQRLRLNYLCCKWRHFVLEQLAELDKDVQGVINVMDKNHGEDGQIETRNQTVDNYGVEMPEVSIETKTELGAANISND